MRPSPAFDPRQRYRADFDDACARGFVDPDQVARGVNPAWLRYLHCAEMCERPSEEWELARWTTVPSLILQTAGGAVRLEPSIARQLPLNEVLIYGRRGSVLARHLERASIDGVIQAVHDFLTWGEQVELVMVDPRLFARLQSDVAQISGFALGPPVRISMPAFDHSTIQMITLGDQVINAEALRRLVNRRHATVTWWPEVVRFLGEMQIDVAWIQDRAELELRPTRHLGGRFA